MHFLNTSHAVGKKKAPRTFLGVICSAYKAAKFSFTVPESSLFTQDVSVHSIHAEHRPPELPKAKCLLSTEPTSRKDLAP